MSLGASARRLPNHGAHCFSSSLEQFVRTGSEMRIDVGCSFKSNGCCLHMWHVHAASGGAKLSWWSQQIQAVLGGLLLDI